MGSDIVSVILPIYNSEKYISETLDSVLNQTYKKLQVIVIDDCSVDKSYSVLNEYLKRDSRILYKKLETNMGVGVAREAAMKLAIGKYIAFIDSDDLWDSDKVAKQLDLIKTKECIMVYTSIRMIDENGKILKKKRKIKEEISYEFLLKNTAIATSTVLLDRDKIKGLTMPLRRSGQDYEMWLQILKRGNAFGINEDLVSYRIRKGSLSSNKLKSIKQVYSIQRKNGIKKIKAIINCGYFIVNALKKYFL